MKDRDKEKFPERNTGNQVGEKGRSKTRLKERNEGRATKERRGKAK